MAQIAQPPLPAFEVRLAAPDHRRLAGGQHRHSRLHHARRRGGRARMSRCLALTHGNEIAGAIVLDQLLRSELAPAHGRLTFGFVNLAAFERFDPRQPTPSRFVDEDINRVWDVAVLDGPRRSVELERAREIRPLIDTVDVLLDLHSMLWPSDPLILCGSVDKGRVLARGIGAPPLVVADSGHASGRRIIDYARFAPTRAPSPIWWRPASTGSRRRWRRCTPASAACCATWALPNPLPPAPANAATFCRGHHGDHRGQQRLRVRAALARRRHHCPPQHPDRAGRRDGDPHAV